MQNKNKACFSPSKTETDEVIQVWKSSLTGEVLEEKL